MAGIRSLIARLLFVGLVALAVQGAPSSRLQPCSMSAVGLLTLSFAYGAGDTGCSATNSDNNGNILKQTITPTVAGVGPFSQSYTYDELNRLSSVQETTTSWSRTYHYDAFGNRAMRGAVPTPAAAPLCAEDDPSLGCSTQAGTTADKPGFVPASNRLTADWASYDLAGNLLWYKDPLSSGARQWSAAYDANNKQSQFCAGASGPCTGTTATYEYDGQGNRIKKTTAARSTTFVYDAFGMLTAEYSTAPPTTAGGRFFRTTDHLGSTRLVTDHEGGCKVWQDFYPFGERILGDASAGRQGWNCYGGAGTDPFAQEFTAKERDEESGSYFFNARYVASIMGRFTSVDPLSGWPSEPQSWNRYAYVLNSPLRYRDPTGMATTDARGNWVGIYHGERNCATGDCLYWNAAKKQWEGEDPRPPIPWWDLPGQWFVGLGDLALNNDSSGATRVAYAYAANAGAGYAIGTATRFGTNWYLLRNFRFAQSSARADFSAGGRLAGQTIDDVAGALESGALSAADVPIEVVVVNGTTLVLNTRSTVALVQAGVPRVLWNVKDVTGSLV